MMKILNHIFISIKNTSRNENIFTQDTKIKEICYFLSNNLLLSMFIISQSQLTKKFKELVS